MCGIAVAIDWPEAEASVARLIDGILHRGDVSDPIVAPRANCAMATRRLRIVDAEHGIQPQFSYDGRLAVSFNGEIYNHASLRAELEDVGATFKTDSDTEVLANALRVWGHRALTRLNGMYAFVALDCATGNFLAARDPFGVKPLYLIQSGERFMFCSEMRPLLDTVESGDVLLLPPGYALTRAGCAAIPSPLREPKRLLKGDAIALDRILADAVRLRLPPDLPAAVLFSGGIDSTLVAHYARQVRPETPGYFVGNTSAPDFRYAAEYAAMTGFDLRIVPFDAESDAVFDTIGEVVRVCESFDPNLVRGAQDPNARKVRNEVLGLMHRVSLQRVDRGSMRYQVEMREPFLDRSVANYALALEDRALVRDINGLPTGKQPLRELYALYPEALPESIANRAKVPFGEGAGLNVSPEDSLWKRRFETEISDHDFRDGQREFFGFGLQSKEELYYLRKLAEAFDVVRVPHLRGRGRISFDMAQHGERLKAYAHARL